MSLPRTWPKMCSFDFRVEMRQAVKHSAVLTAPALKRRSGVPSTVVSFGWQPPRPLQIPSWTTTPMLYDSTYGRYPELIDGSAGNSGLLTYSKGDCFTLVCEVPRECPWHAGCRAVAGVGTMNEARGGFYPHSSRRRPGQIACPGLRRTAPHTVSVWALLCTLQVYRWWSASDGHNKGPLHDM